MPRPASSNSKQKAAEPRTAPDGVKRFDFKKVKRVDPSARSYAGGRARTGASKTTVARIQKAVYQTGEKQGQETGSTLFIFNPAKGLNDAAKAAVKELAYPCDDVSGFNKELGGFVVKVRTPAQARRMNEALAKIDRNVKDLDVGDFADPEMEIAKVVNVDLPESITSVAKEGVTALMLVGDTYPLHKKLRELGWDYIRDIHHMPGANGWVRTADFEDEDVSPLLDEVWSMLVKEGWKCNTATGDANDWKDEADGI